MIRLSVNGWIMESIPESDSGATAERAVLFGKNWTKPEL